mgnify:CR=1 FL=1
MDTSHPDSETLSARLAVVRQRVDAAARASGRSVDEITLIAVSKRHPAASVSALATLGHVDFGESYIQEALAKREILSTLALRWHFIGRLQTNKARLCVNMFSWIHTIDSTKLALALHKCCEPACAAHGAPQPVLVQVNVGQEAQKAGVAEDDLPDLIEVLLGLPHLALGGLMCLPPFFDEAERSRPYFERLRTLRDDMEVRFGIRFPHLSMGMSHDLEQAIAAGATMVRVGTDIFGPRP